MGATKKAQSGENPESGVVNAKEDSLAAGTITDFGLKVQNTESGNKLTPTLNGRDFMRIQPRTNLHKHHQMSLPQKEKLENNLQSRTRLRTVLRMHLLKFTLTLHKSSD